MEVGRLSSKALNKSIICYANHNFQMKDERMLVRLDRSSAKLSQPTLKAEFKRLVVCIMGGTVTVRIWKL